MEKSGYHYATLEERNKSVKSYKPDKSIDRLNNNEFREIETYKKESEIVPVKKEEEWETSKKVINHKTRQIETRIQRQILMEDGKVIADSGPQVTTRTKEDQKTEESENKRKLKGDQDPHPGKGYEALPGEQVFSEKMETHNTTRTARQENMQYHDESLKELSGYDLHRRAITAPNELVQIDDNELSSEKPPGKLTHYSAKSKKFSDREEIKELSKRGRDGKVVTERTRTNHHEEYDDDELPEDDEGVKALPEASREATREVAFQNDSDSLASSMRRITVDDRHRRSQSRDYDRDSLDRQSQERKMRYESAYSRQEKKSEASNLGSSHRSRFDDDYRRSRNSYRESGDRQQSSINRRSVDRRSVDRCSFKEDASVQASFSSSSEDEMEGRHEQERMYKREERRREERREEKPTRSFYFGENSHRRSPSPAKSSLKKGRQSSERPIIATDLYSSDKTRKERQENYDLLEQSTRNLIDDLEREWRSPTMVDGRGSSVGEIKADFKQEFKSKINDRVVNDQVRNESFHREFKSPEEKAQVQRSFDELMDKSFRTNFASRDNSPARRYHEPISWSYDDGERIIPVRHESGNSRRSFSKFEKSDYQTSSRLSNRSGTPSPVRFASDSRDRSSRLSNRSGRDSSPSNGTYTKSKGRKVHSQIDSRISDFPDFSPLSAPNEILRKSYDSSKSESSKSKKYAYHS